jgi:cell envelope opacity-associated protein A
MKKIIAAFTCIVFATGSLQADEATPTAPAAVEQEQPEQQQQQSAPKQVSKAPEDSGSSNVWKNWAIAAGVVIIAVVALILVSRNEGSRH